MVAENRKTTMGHITQEHLAQSKISIPPIELISKLDLILNPILEKIACIKAENSELENFKNWLLPLLMTQQVRPQ